MRSSQDLGSPYIHTSFAASAIALTAFGDGGVQVAEPLLCRDASTVYLPAPFGEQLPPAGERNVGGKTFDGLWKRACGTRARPSTDEPLRLILQDDREGCERHAGCRLRHDETRSTKSSSATSKYIMGMAGSRALCWSTPRRALSYSSSAPTCRSSTADTQQRLLAFDAIARAGAGLTAVQLRGYASGRSTFKFRIVRTTHHNSQIHHKQDGTQHYNEKDGCRIRIPAWRRVRARRHAAARRVYAFSNSSRRRGWMPPSAPGHCVLLNIDPTTRRRVRSAQRL